MSNRFGSPSGTALPTILFVLILSHSRRQTKVVPKKMAAPVLSDEDFTRLQVFLTVSDFVGFCKYYFIVIGGTMYFKTKSSYLCILYLCYDNENDFDCCRPKHNTPTNHKHNFFHTFLALRKNLIN